MSVWISTQNFVILGQTIYKMFTVQAAQFVMDKDDETWRTDHGLPWTMWQAFRPAPAEKLTWRIMMTTVAHGQRQQLMIKLPWKSIIVISIISFKKTCLKFTVVVGLMILRNSKNGKIIAVCGLAIGAKEHLGQCLGTVATGSLFSPTPNSVTSVSGPIRPTFWCSRTHS